MFPASVKSDPVRSGDNVIKGPLLSAAFCHGIIPLLFSSGHVITQKNARWFPRKSFESRRHRAELPCGSYLRRQIGDR